MDVVDVVAGIPNGELRSYSWVAERLGYSGQQAAQAAGQAIKRETLRRFPTPEVDAREPGDDFPWWRVVDVNGNVRTVLEDPAWYMRQVRRLESEEHRLAPSRDLPDALRVTPLPHGFQ